MLVKPKGRTDIYICVMCEGILPIHKDMSNHKDDFTNHK